ncbi:MAG: hypothetical protein ACKVI3_03885 [Verrucomicrobiia bacterium]|tara:strand:- start:91 stop:453 length:363 start_codon:yes stop_codon:yes gene_type:complete
MSVFDRSDMKIWVTLGEDFVTAAELALRQAKKVRRRNRVSPTAPRRNPGHDTPLWNIVIEEMRGELKTYGAKSRLARFLEVPPQRISDWVTGQRRVPDAETLLRILFWLQQRRAGLDISI